MREKGFAALVSVIIIALVMMLVTTSLSFSSYYTRFNVLDRELKEVSAALAESCVEVARLRLANSSMYNPLNELVSLGEGECTIVSININNGVANIRASALYKDYQTHLEAGVNMPNLDIVYWREVGSF